VHRSADFWGTGGVRLGLVKWVLLVLTLYVANVKMRKMGL